jgi:hypothetical protein
MVDSLGNFDCSNRNLVGGFSMAVRQKYSKKFWTVLSRFFVIIAGAYIAYLFFLVVAYPFGF